MDATSLALQRIKQEIGLLYTCLSSVYHKKHKTRSLAVAQVVLSLNFYLSIRKYEINFILCPSSSGLHRSLNYLVWGTFNKKVCFYFHRALLENTILQIMYVHVYVTISNPKSNLNDAIYLFMTKPTRTLVAENQHGLRVVCK